MTDLQKAAQDVIDRWHSPKWAHDSVHTGVLIDRLRAALAKQPAPHARDAVAWTPDTGYVFADAKNAQAAPDDAKQRLLEIMRRNGLATGHGDTIDDALKELDWQLSELKGEK